MTRGEFARHRASVRAGERCGIRRQYPWPLMPRSRVAGYQPPEKPLLPAPAQHLPNATEIPSTLAVQTLSPTPADHTLPARRKDT